RLHCACEFCTHTPPAGSGVATRSVASSAFPRRAWERGAATHWRKAMAETNKENPLTLGTPRSLLPRPCILVIFGAAGDLSWRKLLPAIYNLNADGLLPSNFAVVGFGIGSQGDPDEWIRQRAQEGTRRFSRRPPTDEH